MASLFKKDSFFVRYRASDGTLKKQSLKTSNRTEAEKLLKEFIEQYGQR